LDRTRRRSWEIFPTTRTRNQFQISEIKTVAKDDPNTS
jgi:hypothetical protein